MAEGLSALDDGSLFTAKEQERLWMLDTALFAAAALLAFAVLWLALASRRYYRTPLCIFAAACASERMGMVLPRTFTEVLQNMVGIDFKKGPVKQKKLE